MLGVRVHKFYAHHGTTKPISDIIVNGRNFIPGVPRIDHWLGQGIYFFREDYDQAHIWAVYKIRNTPSLAGEKPAVVEVILECNESNFLNLDTRKGLIILSNFIEELEKQGLIIKTNGPVEPEKLRCYILSLLPDDIWLVQKHFTVKSIYDANRVMADMEIRLGGIQLCVRNDSIILGDSIQLVCS